MSVKLVSDTITISGNGVKFGNYIGETVTIDHRSFVVIEVTCEYIKCSLI